MTLLVRAESDPASFAPEVRTAVQPMDAYLPVFGVITLRRSTPPPRSG